ncbi:MAG TPA: diguanylate cyclase [Bryobacteraceae bacterium]|nr:diguanylate cyclase [Bryobacteraceae bacterium]
MSLKPDRLILREALRDEELLNALLDQVDAGVYIVDRSRRILYWNTGAERITGYLSQDVAGRFCHGDLLMHCDAAGAGMCGTGCPLLAVMKDGQPRECTLFLRHRNGHRVPVQVRSRSIVDSTGATIGALEVFHEIRGGARPDAGVLEQFGCLDPVTGVANRRYGEMKVAHALETLETFGLPFGWLQIELDGLEELEHRFGREMIDAAAKMIARTLDANLGPLDLLMSWGRAAFRIKVHGCTHQGLAELAEKLVALARVSNLEWWGDPRRVTVAIAGGMAQRRDTIESLEARVAEVLMNCRASGGNRAMIHGERIDLRAIRPERSDDLNT